MPWDDLAYFAMMFFIGLSILTVCLGLTVRLFLGPVLRDMADRMGRPKGDEALLLGRITQLDDRLAALEGGLDRIEAAQDFDRRLGAGSQESTTS